MDQALYLKDNNCSTSGAVTFNDAATAAGLTVGQKLSEARLSSSKTDMKDISGELCIRPHLLAALEQDDFDKFPSACYAAGFLKNYATYLDLNVGQIVAQYKREFQGSMKKVDLDFIKVEKPHNNTPQMIVSLVILSVIVLYGVWYSASGSKRLSLSSLPDVSDITSNILLSAAEETQKPTVTTAVFTEVEVKTLAYPKKPSGLDGGFNLVQPVNATPQDIQFNSPILTEEQVRLSMREDAWIRIVSADKEILVDRVLLAGEEFYMTDRKGMTLMTSNAGALSIFVGDIAVSLLGASGEIRENISLDKNDLLMTSSQLYP